MSAETKRRSREKTRAYRERMRAKGLRPVQFWLPDTRTPEFAERAARESLAIANSPQEADDQAFIDAVSELKFELNVARSGLLLGALTMPASPARR